VHDFYMMGLVCFWLPLVVKNLVAIIL